MAQLQGINSHLTPSPQRGVPRCGRGGIGVLEGEERGRGGGGTAGPLRGGLTMT